MLTVVAIVHIIFCLLLIAIVLLQDPKSNGSSGMFGGGGSNSVLGATGAETFLTKLTRYSAVTFGVTCLLLTILSHPNGGSVIDTMPVSAPAAPAKAPTTDAQPAAPAGQPAAEAPAAQAPATAPDNSSNPAPAAK